MSEELPISPITVDSVLRDALDEAETYATGYRECNCDFESIARELQHEITREPYFKEDHEAYMEELFRDRVRSCFRNAERARRIKELVDFTCYEFHK